MLAFKSGDGDDSARCTLDYEDMDGRATKTTLELAFDSEYSST